MSSSVLPIHALGRASVEHAGERLEALDPIERALLSTRATGKRRDEFVAGRLAVHEALRLLMQHEGGSAAGWLVVAETGDTKGRPRVVDSELRAVGVEVSISHCGPLALAVAARERVGVDLVEVEEQSAAFVEEAFAGEEIDRWAAALGLERMDPRVVAHAFAGKEALLKWLGQGFGLPLRSVGTWPSAAIDPEGEASGVLIVRGPVGQRRLGVRRWFEEGLLALLVG